MGLLKNIWNGVKNAAGKVWNATKELGGNLATGIAFSNPGTSTAIASLANTRNQIQANFQMEAARLTVSRQNNSDIIEANRENTNNRIVADAQMETRRQELRVKELETQWLNQYALQKYNQKFNYEEARRRHDEAIELANLSYENQQKIETFRQEWENTRLAIRQDFELMVMESRQKHEWELRKYDRETMLIQASIQLQNMMQSSEYQRILNNHALISNSIPTLHIYRQLDPSKPVPLLVIISPPAVEFEKFPHAGQGLAKIETKLTDNLREFLQDHQNYPIESTIRPTKFLGGVWDTKRLHSEGAVENLFYTHQSIPTLILESKVDGNFINIYIASWDSLDIHYRYKKIISIPWKDVLYPLARENARLWRETRNQLLTQGKTPKEIAEEGGDEEENLKILEAEERDQQQGINKRRDYKVNDDEYIQELAEFLSNVHCILAGLAADQYHLYHYDVTPLLPTLLPELLEKIDDVEIANELINIIMVIYRGIYQSIKTINPSRLPDLALDFALSLIQLEDKFWARSQMNYALVSWLELRDASLIPQDALKQEDNLENQIQLTQALLTAMQSVVIPADEKFIAKVNQCLTALETSLFSILNSCFARGMKKVESSAYSQAITDFDQVIQLDDNYLPGYYQRGLAYLNLKQPEAAISDFTRILDIDPNYALAFRYRGDGFNQMGNRATGINDQKMALQYYQQAVNDYNQAVGLGINDIIEKRDDVIDKIYGIRQKEEHEKRAKALTVNLGNGVTLEMVEIPAGNLISGDSTNMKNVHISAFLISKYTVTQEQYQAIMGTNPSHFQGVKQPVENVSWEDAVDFCNRLSGKTGNKYSLPSEAQWEYACRAKTTDEYYFGNDQDKLNEYAWYKDNSDDQTHPVGQKNPNPWGLYDTYGNVWEWCEDTWVEHDDDTENIHITDETSIRKVLRGGSWGNQAVDCSSKTRNWGYSNLGDNIIGFRLVCCIEKSFY